MKKLFLVITGMFLISGTILAKSKNDLKIFISVDMEGISGIVNWEEVGRTGKDYDYFRTVMTKETNAAIEGALEAGATEIVVRDAHSSARNILPEELNENAKLIRDWSGGFMSMMEGIDASYDAVIFIGYHAKAGTPNALLEHTKSSKQIIDVSINQISMPEAGINALLAGYYDVPVVFLSGDKAICDQAKNLFESIETVAVKEGLGNAALGLHPETARKQIRKGVKKALSDLKQFKPYKLKSPYILKVNYKNEEIVHQKSYLPGVERTGDWELTFTSNDLMELFKTFSMML